MITLNCFQNFVIKILKQGNIPNHVAFIMDGNRRHAKKNNMPTFKGHQDGAQTLKKCLLYCLQLGIKMASFYCFSIQNFNRSQQQVNKLMQLALKSFDELSDISQMVQKKNVQVKIVGKLDLIREDVRKKLLQIQKRTQNNTKMTVNLCFAYDSLQEIEKSKSKTKQEQKELTKENIFKNLQIANNIDVLIRTSNESRLSNFMLMQNQISKIVILKQNWPQVSIYSFVRILLSYNYQYKRICQMKNYQKTYNNAIEQKQTHFEKNQEEQSLLKLN